MRHDDQQEIRDAVTLLELVVVFAIAALLMGLLLGAVQKARHAAARAGCQANLKQIALALHNYHDTNKRLPDVLTKVGSSNNYAPLNWMVPLLPFIEHEPLWRNALQACAISKVTFANPPHEGVAIVIPSYVCPSDGRLGIPLVDQYQIVAAYTSYLAVAGDTKANGSMDYPGIRFAQITDGLSNTLLLGERPPPASLQAGWWYSLLSPAPPGAAERGPDGYLAVSMPAGSISCPGTFHFGPGHINNPCDRFHFWSLHTSGANFAFSDGSVRFISYSSAPTLGSLATRAGGEAAIAIE